MPSSKYEVFAQTIEVLLSPDVKFEVPKFQRTYAWGSEEIAQLINDVFGASSRDELPYFLGSIVLASKTNLEGTNSEIILDGQQRLTTISLLIAALIQRMLDYQIDEAYENKKYLFSKRVKGNRRPKLTLQDEDHKSYEELLNDPSKFNDTKFRDTRIGIALGRIFKAIDERAKNLADLGNINRNPYEYMLDRLLYELEIVKITAPSEKDAFRLFETLNDRGLALSGADLIKNKLLLQCGQEIEDAYDAWSSMISLTNDDAVNYLRYFWIAFKGFVRNLGLYDTYKAYIDTLDSTSATLFALEIEDAAKDYHQIITPNIKTCTWGSQVADSLDRLKNSYRARTFRPLVLSCSKYRPQDVMKVVQLCESIVVRYSIVGEKNTNNLEVVFFELCSKLRDTQFPLAEIFSSELLSVIPTDSEFKQKLASMDIPASTPAWKEILIRLNAASGTGETKVNPANVHIEHILPQKPRLQVLEEASITVEDASLINQRIGNLTLLSGTKNREASNKPFSQKSKTYITSEILMTRALANYETWGQAEIEKRSNDLAEIAIKVYPHPSNMVF